MKALGVYGLTVPAPSAKPRFPPPVTRYFRDAPLMIVGEGTNEIQRQ